jgi:hypothetical protein
VAVVEGAAAAEVADRMVVDIMRSSLRSRIRRVSTSSSTSLRSISWCMRDTRNLYHKCILHTIIMIRTMDVGEVEVAAEEEAVEEGITKMEIMNMMTALRQLL